MHTSEIFAPMLFHENEETKKHRSKNQECKNITASFCILREVFFSEDNISIINKQLMMEVFKKNNKKFKIVPQREQNLIIIMNFIFTSYAKNNNNNIKEQIRELNKLVVDEISHKIIVEIKHHLNFIDEVNSNRKLTPLPKNVNNVNTLPSITTTF